MSAESESERPSGTIVARRSRSSKSEVVHLPDEDSDEPEPLCNVAASPSVHRTGYTRGRWIERDHAVYPNRRLCDRCARLAQGKTEAPGAGENR